MILYDHQRIDKKSFRKKRKNDKQIKKLFKMLQDFSNLLNKDKMLKNLELQINKDSINLFKNFCLLGIFNRLKINYQKQNLFMINTLQKKAILVI